MTILKNLSGPELSVSLTETFVGSSYNSVSSSAISASFASLPQGLIIRALPNKDLEF